MPDPVDLLLITWNRRIYLERTLGQLHADPSDFRLYCWDNGSEDGAADLIASLKDPRVVTRRFSRENVNQRAPWLWFLDEARGNVVGKVDDDVLLPPGWTERFKQIFEREPKCGMLGCWIFMEEDWHEPSAQSVIDFGGERLLRTVGMQGCAFLGRKALLKRYVTPPDAYGLPVDRYQITLDGWVTGLPLPPAFAHHMDDPRSPECVFTKEGAASPQASLTARQLGFADADAYGKWIAAEAARVLDVPFARRLAQVRLDRRTDWPARMRRKARRTLARLHGFVQRCTANA